mgnify:CR=1 FL=1
MIINIKQWETKEIQTFSIVKDGYISSEGLYRKLIAMNYDFVATNRIIPFDIIYNHIDGFLIKANSHVGVIIYDDLTLCIESMIPELSLGKILLLQSQAKVESDSIAQKTIKQKIAEETKVSAIDYFIVTLVDIIENIKINGILSQIKSQNIVGEVIRGRIDFRKQIKKNPAYDKFHSITKHSDANILPNQIIRSALEKALSLSQLEWMIPYIKNDIMFFENLGVNEIEEIQDIPNVNEYSSIYREDYETALRLSKYILLGYDPLSGESKGEFPEFLLDMNVVFENYVTYGLQRLFKSGFERKKQLTLGVGPVDIPIDRKNIELDGFYSYKNTKVVIDAKDKYHSVIDKTIPDFVATNPDIYQQYYYASRVGAKNIVLVYPSSKFRSKPIGSYQLNFEGHVSVNMFFWALNIAGSPSTDNKALIKLAEFIQEL